uniref:DUF4219 domain-containing protein n=1 Tax=Micrurus spixii TaxID=129469 RepID=A0A2D4LCD3_9SAUR
MAKMAQEPSTNLALITQLDGTNYVSWSMKCSLLLRREGLWAAVNDPPDVNAWDPDDEDDAKKIADFKQINERALCIIVLTLSDQQLVHIHGEESASRFWENLKKIYVYDSAGAHIHFTRKLFRASLMKGGDMLVHLNFMKRTFQELHEKEMIFSELHQVYTILSSLDESYDGYVSSLEVLTKNELNID